MWRQTVSHATKLKLALISICLAISAGAAAVGARQLLTLSAAEAVAAVPEPQNDRAENHRVVLITLRPEGFQPTDITLTAGDYLFVFNNRTGLDEFALRLVREGQGTVREGRPPRFKRKWTQFLRVTPGAYLVTEINHPEWSLRMTVTSQ